MGRAELASAGVRGRSDGRVERRRAECGCVQPCDDMSGQCATTGESCERTMHITPPAHEVVSYEGDNWICPFCGYHNPPIATIICQRCAVMRVINT